MAAAIGLRVDYDARSLRAIAKRSRDVQQARGLLSLASIYDGTARSEAAKIGGVTRQVVRDWVLRLTPRGPMGSSAAGRPDNACRSPARSACRPRRALIVSSSAPEPLVRLPVYFECFREPGTWTATTQFFELGSCSDQRAT